MSNNISTREYNNILKNKFDKKKQVNKSQDEKASVNIKSDNILKIKFDARTLDKKIASNETYKPSMSNPLVYNLFSNILFIPTIPLNKSFFNKSLGEDDIKKIFLSPVQFNSFITEMKKYYKPITIDEAKKSGIIHNNIKFILNLFFKKNSSFTLNLTDYIINNYNWDNKYKLNYLKDKKTPIVEIKIELILNKGKELTFIDSTRLNCMQKRESIINDYKELTKKK